MKSTDAQSGIGSGDLLDRVLARLDEAEANNRRYEKMQRDRIVIIGKHYQRNLKKCDEMLTNAGVPEWVMNSDSDGVPGNSVTERLKWYLARRKDVKPEEAEPKLQAEMKANIAAASAYRSNDPSSATRRSGRHDCNRDAPAGFAAAHG